MNPQVEVSAVHRRLPRSTLVLPAFTAILLLFLFPRAGHAYNCFWTGDAALGPEWSRLQNWSLLQRPGDTDLAYFQEGAGYHGVTVDQAWTLQTMYLTDSQTYLFSGSQLTFLDGGIEMSAPLSGSSANHGFLCPVRFQGSGGTIDNIAGAQLTLTGDVNLAVSGDVAVSNHPDSPVAIRGHITGSATDFSMQGSGTLTLSASNTYTAQTSIDLGGTILAAADEVIGTGTLFIQEGTLDLAGHNETVGPGAASGYGIQFNSPGGQVILGGTDNTLTISTLGTWIIQAYGGTSSISGGQLPLATSSGTREIDVQFATGGLTIDSQVTGGGSPGSTPSLKKTGPGSLVLGGANSFVRSFLIQGGTVRITDPSALGATGVGNETLLAGGDLLLELGVSGVPIAESLEFTSSDRLSALAPCEWSGPVRVSSSSAEFSAEPGADLIISGAVTGDPATGVRKTGAGTLTLTGDNAYSGGTTVEAGALVANALTGSPTGSGPVSVRAGAVLAARGALAGPVSLDSLATLRIGDDGAAAVLSTPAFTGSAADTVRMDLAGAPGATSDRLEVAGTATLAGVLRAALLNQPAEGDSFTVMTYADHAGEFDALELPAPEDSTLRWQVEYGPSALTLRVAAAATSVADRSDETPLALRFDGPVPNPTPGTSAFRFDLPRAARVDLMVYDVQGREVAEVVRDAAYTAGTHRVSWDARDNTGRVVAPGAYLARLSVDGAPAGPAQRVIIRR